MDFMEYGLVPELLPEDAPGVPARITAVHRERFALVCEYGEGYARLKTKEYYAGSEEFPTVGDFVLIHYIANGDSQIIRTLPRKTFFSRRDPTPGRGEQAVAANFDYVFIMQSLNLNFNERRLERYLTLAWQSGAVPVIVLTKADLVEDCSAYIRAAERVAFGAAVHTVSAMTGFGMEALEEYMQPGKTVVFLGSSGVGKSSLVNAFAGEELMAVSEIRKEDARGRHTTTHRQLIRLQSGAMVIDTPGMRQLGMWDVSSGLGETFADVEAFLGKCRFGDCRHLSKPGCAVQKAIADGALSVKRWKSYCTLRKEARYLDAREARRQRQQKKSAGALRKKGK